MTITNPDTARIAAVLIDGLERRERVDRLRINQRPAGILNRLLHRGVARGSTIEERRRLAIRVKRREFLPCGQPLLELVGHLLKQRRLGGVNDSLLTCDRVY